MSRKNTSRKAEKLKRKAEEAARYKKTKRKVRLISAIVTVSVILVLFVSLIVGVAVWEKRLDSGDYLRGEIAASSKNIQVDGAMMNYFLNDFYNTFVAYYGSYVEAYGLDTSKPLVTQYMPDGESWFEYFMSGAKANVTNILAFAEEARALDIDLTEAEKKALLHRAESVDTGLYGRGVNTTDVYNVKLMEALAYKFRFMKEEESFPTEEEILEYYLDNSKDFQYVDYYEFPIYYSDEAEAGSGKITKPTADELLSLFADVTNAEEFEDAVKTVLKKETPEISEEEILGEISKLGRERQLYSKGNEVSEWAFSADEGDIFTVHDEENQRYYVYMITKSPYRDESKSVSFRHILLTAGRYGENLEKTADELLVRLNKSENCEEEFMRLVLEYSEDESSYYGGGKYRNIVSGRDFTEIEAWCFDDDRTQGELGLVETNLGTHIMYFIGGELAAWQSDVAESIVYDRITEYQAALTEVHGVVFDENVIDMIPDPGA